MTARVRLRAAYLTVGLAATVILAAVAFLAWIPVHRSPIYIVDSAEPDIPPDFDALLLRGQQEGETFVVTLSVAGVVQASLYNVGVLVQDLGRPGETYVYELEYQSGEEKNYAIPTIRDGNSLTFRFPLKTLSKNAYIVGLDAAIFGPDTTDYFVEGRRESLRIQRLLPLPVDSALLIAAAAAIAVVTIVARIRTLGRIRGSDL